MKYLLLLLLIGCGKQLPSTAPEVPTPKAPSTHVVLQRIYPCVKEQGTSGEYFYLLDDGTVEIQDTGELLPDGTAQTIDGHNCVFKLSTYFQANDPNSWNPTGGVWKRAMTFPNTPDDPIIWSTKEPQ